LTAPIPVSVDTRRFRRVFGHFCTGVTVITTADEAGPAGFACQAFAPLSLDPPLVLFCARSTSATARRIREAGVFAVNVLADDQKHLSRTFGSAPVPAVPAVPAVTVPATAGAGVPAVAVPATAVPAVPAVAVPATAGAGVPAVTVPAPAGAGRFAGVPWEPAPSGAPILTGALTWADCRIDVIHPGGDHDIVIGRVTALGSCRDAGPLVFHRGRYTATVGISPHEPPEVVDTLLSWPRHNDWI
jgi:3-hydroxy-9,10-secoandrosta-1,3,5(10)-triene-9,17-dione monooxygenase reductase component